MSEFVASLFAATGKNYMSTTSHPAMIRHRAKSPLWKMTRRPSLVSAPTNYVDPATGMGSKNSSNRITAGFDLRRAPERGDGEAVWDCAQRVSEHFATIERVRRRRRRA